MPARVELILRKDVEALGKVGDVVTVAHGYARIYLIPGGFGAAVTPEALQGVACERTRLVKEEAERLAALKAQARKLESVSVTLAVKVGEEGQLYGSVTGQDIAKALAAEGVTVDPKQIVLDQPIKILGVANVSVRLHPDVAARIKVWVVEE